MQTASTTATGPSWTMEDRVVIEEWCYGTTEYWGNPKEMEASLRERLGWGLGSRTDRDENYRIVCRLSASNWSLSNGCSVTVRNWDPFTCQGGFGFPSYTIRFVPKARAPEARRKKLGAEPKEDFMWGIGWVRTGTKFICTDETIPNRRKPTLPEFDRFHPVEAPDTKGFDCLFHIVMSSGVRVLEVGSLGDELAYPALCSALQASQTIKHLEIANRFRDNGDLDPALEKKLTLDLCARVLASTTSITRLYFPNLHQYSQEQIQKLFQSLDANTGLDTLDLRHGRYIHTWGKADKYTANKDEHFPAGGISLEPLIETLCNPENGFSLKKLDLSGLVLSTSSVVALAEALPGLGLETLMLRDTALGRVALTAIAKALKHDHTIEALDISHNSITDHSIMEELCDSLKENSTLRTLKMQHCDIRIGLLEILADALPDIKGLQNLDMDANDFALSPRRVVVDEENDRYVGVFPVGPILLVDALEHNYNLLNLSVSLLYGPPGQSYGMVCCTSPPYSPWLSGQHATKLKKYEKRNQAIKERNRKTKMQETVVRFAGLMLKKVTEE